MAGDTALGAGDGHALACSSTGQIGLELGDHGQGREQEPPDRIGGVVQRAADVQPHSAAGELVDDVAGVGHGAGEPIELGDYQRVAAAAGSEGLAQAGSIAVGAGQPVVDIDAFRVNAERDKRVALRGEVLIDGRHPGVADLEFGHRISVPVSLPPPGRFTEPVLRDAGAAARSVVAVVPPVCRRRFGYRAGVPVVGPSCGTGNRSTGIGLLRWWAVLRAVICLRARAGPSLLPAPVRRKVPPRLTPQSNRQDLAGSLSLRCLSACARCIDYSSLVLGVESCGSAGALQAVWPAR